MISPRSVAQLVHGHVSLCCVAIRVLTITDWVLMVLMLLVLPADQFHRHVMQHAPPGKGLCGPIIDECLTLPFAWQGEPGVTSALHVAAMRGDVELARLLLAAGAHPVLQDYAGEDAIMVACRKVRLAH